MILSTAFILTAVSVENFRVIVITPSICIKLIRATPINIVSTFINGYWVEAIVKNEAAPIQLRLGPAINMVIFYRLR